jgi:thioester reductase-like protein
MAAVFVTGFVSSAGSALVERLLARYPPDVPIYCLVQIALRRRAEERLAEIERIQPDFSGRIRLLEGAITLPDLGLGTGYGRVNKVVTELFHLAVVDEGSKGRDFATKVNLIGAQNVLNFAERCPHFERFHYLSSCLVSGAYAGKFHETDLDKGQAFRNHHEETLFLAEMEVQRAAQAGMAVRIYRPGHITGDSRSGAIHREDALHGLLSWLLRQPAIDVPILTGNPYRVRVNVVPRDYVAAAVCYLSALERPSGSVYHIIDPNAARLHDFLRVLGEVTGRRLIQIWAPARLARAFQHIDPTILSSLHQPARCTADHTLADLDGSGFTCPPFGSYADRLADYVLMQPESSHSQL